jgi:hypothetical protein
MRKEYDLTALKVKRRGPVKALAPAMRKDVRALKKQLLHDKQFIKAVAQEIDAS